MKSLNSPPPQYSSHELLRLTSLKKGISRLSLKTHLKHQSRPLLGLWQDLEAALVLTTEQQMPHNCNISLTGSTPVASAVPHKVRLKAHCPLAGFNQLFPAGIPVADAEPSLSIGDWECYEAVLPRPLDTAALLLFQPHTPEALCRVWLEWGIVALPIDWVEVTP